MLEAAIGAFELTARRLDAHLKHVWDGVLPTSRVKTRSKFRTLIDIRSASVLHDSHVSRCSAIQMCSSRIDVISEACEASETLSCGCPPGRRRNSTSSRAASCASPAPQSSSTHSSARSMPAEMPADV